MATGSEVYDGTHSRPRPGMAQCTLIVTEPVAMPLHRRYPACLCLGLLLGCACASNRAVPADLQVLASTPPRLLEASGSAGLGFAEACTGWALDTSQATQFFMLATEVEPESQHRFDYLPCEIAGELMADGQRWHYRINAAGTAHWLRDGGNRYFACTQPACEPLLLMLPEPGDP
jgi:hypothetical protein